MTCDTRNALYLMGELVAALRANLSDAFRDLLAEGNQEVGVTEADELPLGWLHSFMTAEQQHRLTVWDIGAT